MKYLYAFILALAIAGCDINQVVYTIPPEPEVPVVNIPPVLRQKNWASKTPQKMGQGSCVHASSIALFNWLGEYKLAKYWRGKYSGGETSVSITKYWSQNGLPYVSTLNERTYECSGDPSFLRWASETRRGAIVWWKESHCCTFCGFCERGGKQYAIILDNNYIDNFEYVPVDEFIRKWRGFGGFAATPILSPAGPIPWPIVMPRSKEKS